MPNYFPSSPLDPYAAVLGQTYEFQGSLLLADTPSLTDTNVNKVATIGWVQSYLLGQATGPQVKRAPDKPLAIILEGGALDLPDGSSVNVPSRTQPISVMASNTEYVWYRYLDNEVVVNTSVPAESDGIIIATVTSNANTITAINHMMGSSAWASTISPTFMGTPTVPTPPIGSDDRTIPNTEWVNLTIDAALSDLSTSTPPPTSNDETVPNTEWVRRYVEAMLTGEDEVSVSKMGALSVGVSPGPVGNCVLPQTGPITVRTNAGVGSNPTEKVWVRSSDCTVVVSEVMEDGGTLLAEVFSDDTEITRIVQMGGVRGRLTEALRDTFVVGYGGNLIYKDA